jgi:hypothetical protein
MCVLAIVTRIYYLELDRISDFIPEMLFFAMMGGLAGYVGLQMRYKQCGCASHTSSAPLT